MIPIGSHVVHFVCTNRSSLQFYHSSPGTGTRVAEIDLENVFLGDEVAVFLGWSPEEVRLDFSVVEREGTISALGVKSRTQHRVGKDGNVYAIDGVDANGEPLETSHHRVYKYDQLIIEPSAIEFWADSTIAAKLLLDRELEKGSLHEVAVTNSILSIMVTGFESYTKRRFLELEGEGIRADMKALTDRFFSTRERKKGLVRDFYEEAKEEGKSALVHLIDKDRINFQSYDDCKRAYGKAYNLSFGNDIGLDSKVFTPLKEYIRYRHQVIHVSPLIPILESPDKSKELVRPTKELALEAANCFNTFIEHLHQATLKLRP